MKNDSLQAGQIIKMSGALYRVDFVNPCRARVVPLAKRHVTLADGREFDAERAGISISAGAVVEIITNLEAARDKIELEEIEREMREAEQELKREKDEILELKHLEAEIEAARAAAAEGKAAAHKASPPAQPQKAASKPPSPAGASTGAGWHVGTVAWPAFKAGTLAAIVRDYILAHPGQTTAEIVANVQAEGTVSACVSRFSQAGYITKNAPK